MTVFCNNAGMEAATLPRLAHPAGVGDNADQCVADTILGCANLEHNVCTALQNFTELRGYTPRVLSRTVSWPLVAGHTFVDLRQIKALFYVLTRLA